MASLPDWEETTAGIVLPVLAQAGARQNGVKGVRDGRLVVAVTQAPEQGKANDALIEALSDALQVKRRQIQLLSGATNPRKRFLISGANLEALAIRVSEIIDES